MSTACRPDAASTVAPQAAAPDELDAGAEDESSRDEAEATAFGEDGFVVTLASECRDTWNGMLVQGAEHKGEARPKASGWDPGGFEIRQSSNRELVVRRGDSLLLTTPNGGIMALSFENLRAGYGALVEVTRECSGVNQTVVRAAERPARSPR